MLFLSSRFSATPGSDLSRARLRLGAAFPPLLLLVFLLLLSMALAPGAALARSAGADESTQEPQTPDNAQGAGEATPSSADASATTGEPFVDNIVVTARKRSENLQEIPVSVTAFDSDSIEERSLRDLSDLSELTPNLDISLGPFGGGTSEAAVFIRGVGQGDTAIFSDPGVGIYVDGVYLARAQGAILDLLDLERVEVLRGPQGTLFGKNTTGGAISLITRRPSTELGGKASHTLGEFDRLDAMGTLNLPLGEHLFSTLSLMSTNRDGWTRSLVTGQEFQDDDRAAGRLALEYRPHDRFAAHLTLEKTRERENGGNQLVLAITDTPLLVFYNRVLTDNGLLPYSGELWLRDDFDATFVGSPGFLDLDVEGATLRLEWTGADLSFTSITGYRATEAASTSDGDGSPLVVAEADVEQQHDQISQEIQLTGAHGDLDWVAGAIYLRERPREQSFQRVLGGIFGLLEAAPSPIYAIDHPDNACPSDRDVPCYGGAGNPNNLQFFVGQGLFQDFDLETESAAAFGEATWAAGDRLSLTAGLRLTEDRKTFDYRSVLAFGPVLSDLRAEDSWSDWSGRLSVAFQKTPETLFYSTLARGFKSGGFNGRPQNRPALDPFDPETLLSWEVGAKADLLDRRLRLNAAAFWSDYEDIHFAASLEVNGQAVFVTQNAGDAEIWGFETELQAYLAPTFLVTTSVGHVSSELTRLDPRVPPGTVDLGNMLPRTPEWTWALSGQKTWIVSGGRALIGRFDYSWRSETFQDFSNSPTVVQDDYGLLGARLLYSPASGKWDLALFGTNLTDEQYLEAGFFAAAFGASIGIPARPREWGLTATLRY